MKPNLRSSLAAFLLALTGSTQADVANPNTDWFSQAKYGVFIHFLPAGEAGLKQVGQFDVKALAGQLEEMGAGYLVLTLGQNSGYFNSPNAAYEGRTGYAPGERCATRDLPRDLSQALQPKGIRLMLYLPCQTPNQDRRAQAAFGLTQGAQDQPIDLVFAEKWSAVIQEWADRYGDKVSGWWFDGGYEHIRFNDAIADRYAAAVKHGNPKAIVTFNPGVKVMRWTKAEDYTAGELNEPRQVIPAERWLQGSQWHALTYLGDTWGRRNTRFSDEQWVEWGRKVAARRGVFTLDMGPNYDPAAGPVGQLASAQVKQVKAIQAALRQETNAAMPKRLKRAESFFGIHFDFHAGPTATRLAGTRRRRWWKGSSRRRIPTTSRLTARGIPACRAIRRKRAIRRRDSSAIRCACGARPPPGTGWPSTCTIPASGIPRPSAGIRTGPQSTPTARPTRTPPRSSAPTRTVC